LLTKHHHYHEKDEELRAFSPDAALYGEPKRMKALAAAMHDFNTFVSNHANLQTVMIPLRDGLTLIRYIAPK
jgi:predicted O-methyltransferase YrrM